MFPNTWKLKKKTNNAPDSFKMKTPGHSNLCVYVKYLYKGTRLCNYEAIKLQFLCQNISCIDPAKYGIRSFFKCLRSQKGKDYTRNQDQWGSMFSFPAINHTYATLVV